MEDSLKRVLGKVFEMEEGEITNDLTPENVVLWDSLHHLKMVTEIESVFEIRMTMKEIRGMTTFGKIQEVVKSHLDGRNMLNSREVPESPS
jgi:acyl carrier protein